MRTFSLLAAMAALTFALASCGGDDDKDSGSSDTTSTAARGYADETATVSGVMDDYFAALASGDGAKACGFFTDDAKEKIEATGGSCEDTVTNGVKSTGTEAYENPDIDEPEVSGTTATVHYSLEVKDQKVEADQTLTKVGDDWKLEAATPPGG